MKKILFVIISLISACTQVSTSSQDLDYKINDKFELVQKILDNPDDIMQIIKESKFYNDSLIDSLYFLGNMYYVDNLKKAKNRIISYERYDSLDYFIFHCFGKNKKNKRYSDAIFSFVFLNEKWNLRFIKGDYYNFISDTNNIKYYNENGPFVNDVFPKSNNKYWWNQDYSLNEKLNFLNDLINNPENFQKILKDSEFYNKQMTSSENSEFEGSNEVLKNYFSNYRDSCTIWLNYPFAVNDSSIAKYLNAEYPTDYFVIGYNGIDSKKKFYGYLTIEFIKKNDKWIFNKATKGIQHYIALNPYQYMTPDRYRK